MDGSGGSWSDEGGNMKGKSAWTVEPESYLGAPTPPNTPSTPVETTRGTGGSAEAPPIATSARTLPSVLKNPGVYSDDDYPFAPNNSDIDSNSEMDHIDGLSDFEKSALLDQTRRHRVGRGGVFRRGQGGGKDRDNGDQEHRKRKASGEEQLGGSKSDYQEYPPKTDSPAYQKALAQALNANHSSYQNESYRILHPSSISEGLSLLGEDIYRMIARSRGVSRASLGAGTDTGDDTDGGYDSDDDGDSRGHNVRMIIQLPSIVFYVHSFIKVWSWRLGLIMFFTASFIQIFFLGLVVMIVGTHLSQVTDERSSHVPSDAPFIGVDADDSAHNSAEKAAIVAAEVTIETTLCLFILFLATSSSLTNVADIVWILTRSRTIISLDRVLPLKVALSDSSESCPSTSSTPGSSPAARATHTGEEAKEQESETDAQEQDEEVLQIEPVEVEVPPGDLPMSPLVLVNTRDQFLSSLWHEAWAIFSFLIKDLFFDPLKAVVLAALDFCKRHRDLFNLMCSLLLLGLTRDLDAQEEAASSLGTHPHTGVDAGTEADTCPNIDHDPADQFLPLLPLRRGRRGAAPVERSVNQVAAMAATFVVFACRAACHIVTKIMSWLPYARTLPPLSIWVSYPESEGGELPLEQSFDFGSGRTMWQTLHAVGPSALGQWVFLIAYDPIFYLSTCLFLSTFTTSLFRRIILINRLNGNNIRPAGYHLQARR